MNIQNFESSILTKIRGEKTLNGIKKVKPVKIEGDYTFNMDPKLKYDLDVLSDDLSQNDDALIVIVAPEGSGKTVLETQIGYYLSMKNKTPWGVNNIHFDGQSYINFSLDSNAKVVNCLDESRRALNKMRGMTGNNVEFMNFLSECRDQNQIHIIVLPAYSDLEQYVAIHRVKYIIQVVKLRDDKTKRLIRGTFKIISTKSKAKLKEAWKNGYKEFPRNMIMRTCRFEDVLCLNEKEYKNKKTEAKKERYATKEEEPKLDREVEIALQHHKDGKSTREIAKMVKRSHGTIATWIKQNKDK